MNDSDAGKQRDEEGFAPTRAPLSQTPMSLPYSVLQWGSHPDADNDDCYYGSDYATLDEALVAFAEDAHDNSVAYIQIDGPDHHAIRENPAYHTRAARLEREHEASEWRREQQMQAAMAFGVEGWNDFEGM